MKTLKDIENKNRILSDEMYVITDITSPSIHPFGCGYDIGDKVRLISGVNDSDIPGYHFTRGYVTICRINATRAEFVGMKKEHIMLVE